MWFFFLFLMSEPDLRPVLQFEVPENDEYVSMVFAATFAENGRMYALDPTQPRVLVWNADRTFRKGFGKKGEGPGELMMPVQIVAHEDALYVWQENGRITRFNEEGVYLDSFTLPGPPPRRFRMMDPNTLLIAFMPNNNNTKVYYQFDIRDRENKAHKIARYHNHGFIASRPGSNNATILAYMADVDVQRDSKGQFWYGFGYEPKLMRVDKNGKTLETQTFQLPKQKPSDEDRSYMENLEEPLADGRTIRLKDLPNLKIVFDQDMAHFTQFIIKDDKAAFILTDKGGTDGVGDGGRRASYYVCDLASGKVLSRGSYHLEDGSTVHYRDGRIIAFENNDAGEFQIYEASLKGF